MTVSEFRSSYPEFVGHRTSDIQHAIEIALAIAGNQGNLAIGACTAHVLTVAASERQAEADGGAGVVQEEWVGSRRAQFVTQAGDRNGAFFGRSGYGRTYLLLAKQSHTNLPRVWG